MKQLQKRLELNSRTLDVVKIKTQVIVPQKTLSKLDDRITNARETIVVRDTGSYRNILILDDAIGSGATLNEIAKKIRQKGICQGKIIGLAITGSPNGFEVISEV
jgi:predicted amidophosphoribosyltransferase